MVKLGINIDHVATIRNARGTVYPRPVDAAIIAEQSGADSITMHLREDRRHIKDEDLFAVKDAISIPLNMEMAVTDEMINIAENLQPAYACLVPEKREELTTEGGLDVIIHQAKIKNAIARLAAANVVVSLFIDPCIEQIDYAKQVGAPVIELHAGTYAELEGQAQAKALEQLTVAAQHAHNLGLIVNAGHGLHKQNTAAIAKIPYMHELNIGHSVVADAVLHGFACAVSAIKQVIGDNK